MIDLRGVEPLNPIHGFLNPEANRFDFFCEEMESAPDNSYQCVNILCRLVYNKFCFIGYFKNPRLPFPGITYPENILDKAMVCLATRDLAKPRQALGCALLKLNEQTGFYTCTVCGGNFMKHPECGITSIPEDWLIQDPRVLKHFIQEARESAKTFRENIAKYSNSEQKKHLLEALEKAEKFFVTKILSKCIL